jgi:hypothetical protein
MGNRTDIQGIEKQLSYGSDRLLTEVVECMGLKFDMLTIYDIYLGQGCDPNVKRERLTERWVT